MKENRGKFVLGLVLACGLLCYGGLAQAAALEVGSGYPYSSIQTAINDAVSGVDEVLVHDGTYVENIDFLGKAITVQSVNGAANTTIDGNASGSVVTFNSGEGSGSVLDGFTIQNGSASYGGGIYCSNSSPTITNCTISGNSSTYDGGGIYCGWGSQLTITNCTISGNSARHGGGIAGDYTSPTITNCTITNNTATKYGTRGGGGIMFADGSPVITNCTISGNSSNYSGGGIRLNHSYSSIITNCTISDNSAVHDGGGIACYYGSSPTITNCIIDGNSAGDNGGGIYCGYDASPAITNCTTSGNSARRGGGIYCEYDVSLTVVNSILWGDSPNEIYLGRRGSITITYSDIQEGYGGTGNIDTNPQFVGGGDYHLQPGSPCINAGTLTGAPEYDFEGDPRLASVGGDNMPDMGADECIGCAPACTDADGDGYAIEGGECGPIDCDDTDANTYPGAPEVCDGKDNDCDGRTDEEVLNTYYRDADEDGYGDPNDITLACSAPPSYVSDNTDNCPSTYNPDQADADGDGIGDACDPCDDRPITGTISPSLDTIWPPNHKMVAVTIDASGLVTHNPDDTHISITSVDITEYSRKTGEDIYEANKFEPDVEITGDLSLNLRSERAGKSLGRTYTITVTATDCSGDYTFTTQVVVAHDKGKGKHDKGK